MGLRDRGLSLAAGAAASLALYVGSVPAARSDQMPPLDYAKPFTQIQQALAAVPALASTLKRKDWPHCDSWFITCFFDPFLDRRRLDPNNLAATASYYASQVAPQFRSYLASVIALDTHVRSMLARTRDRLNRTRADPDNTELAAALTDELQSLEELVKLPLGSSGLQQAVQEFERRLNDDDTTELASLKMRQDFLADRRSFEQTMKQPAYQQMCRQQPPPANICSLPHADDAPASAVMELEVTSLLQLRSGNDAIKAALPNLIGCVTAAKSAEAKLRDNLAAAIASKSLDETSRRLDVMDASWPELIGYAKTCSDPRLWD